MDPRGEKEHREPHEIKIWQGRRRLEPEKSARCCPCPPGPGGRWKLWDILRRRRAGSEAPMSPRRDGCRAEGEDGVEDPLGSFPGEEGVCRQQGRYPSQGHPAAPVGYFGLHQGLRRPSALAKCGSAESCPSRRGLLDTVLPKANIQDRKEDHSDSGSCQLMCWYVVSNWPFEKRGVLVYKCFQWGPYQATSVIVLTTVI